VRLDTFVLHISIIVKFNYTYTFITFITTYVRCWINKIQKLIPVKFFYQIQKDKIFFSRVLNENSFIFDIEIFDFCPSNKFAAYFRDGRLSLFSRFNGIGSPWENKIARNESSEDAAIITSNIFYVIVCHQDVANATARI